VADDPWQIVALPLGLTGIPTVGCTVTVVDKAEDVRLQTVPLTLTVADPENPLANDKFEDDPEPEKVPAEDGLTDQL